MNKEHEEFIDKVIDDLHHWDNSISKETIRDIFWAISMQRNIDQVRKAVSYIRADTIESMHDTDSHATGGILNKKYSLKQLFTSEVKYEEGGSIDKRSNEIATTLNMKLGEIFFNASAIRALAKHNPEFFEKQEVKHLLDKIDISYDNHNKEEKKFNEQGRSYHSDFKRLLEKEFGTDDIYYKIPQKLGYNYRD